MSAQQNIPAALIKEYNLIVRGFKEAWGAMRAISVMRPDESDVMLKAKTRIKELQRKVVAAERDLRKGQAEGIGQQLKMLNLELRVFRELLEQIESSITPKEIRGFLQKTHDTKEQEIVEMISYYCRKSTFSEIDLDKLDLLMTEACANRVGYKRVLKPPFEIENLLKKLFERDVPVDEYEDAIIHEFETAGERIQNAADVDEIVKNEIIVTMRNFKREVLDLFRNPRVMQASVKYNVALTNKLVSILEKEEGEIMGAHELAQSIKSELGKLAAGQQQTANSLIEKVKEIQEAYEKKKESVGYDIKLIVEAAKSRKAIQESIDKLKEIESVEEEKPPEEEVVKRKTVQSFINEIFKGLLRLDSGGEDSIKIQELNLDLKKMDPWEKSLFLMDIQSLGEEKRIYEALREAIVLRSKITEEYKSSKRDLPREEVEEILLENIEMADTLDKEIQGFLDTYNKRSRSFSAIDLIKVKSSLSKSINRLKSLAKMEGFPIERKK